ncbi:DUF3862 domain-containing protein [Metabacillus sp. 113a]|uniref:DUF3862 domain-containing protein n=1 Tax=Metabacillus sp. 113a TaxID=3404706 RepID=UPI003CEFB555
MKKKWVLMQWISIAVVLVTVAAASVFIENEPLSSNLASASSEEDESWTDEESADEDSSNEGSENGFIDEMEDEDTEAAEEPAEEPAEEESEAAPAPAGEVSMEEFNKLKFGISYKEAEEIIGAEGVLESESGDKGSEFHSESYSWETDTDNGSIFVDLRFQEEKLVSKSQYGLIDPKANGKMTKDEYDQIKNGMTLEEVNKIIGGSGTLERETTLGGDYYSASYMYQSDGGDKYSYATLSFDENGLSNKSQSGLK